MGWQPYSNWEPSLSGTGRYVLAESYVLNGTWCDMTESPVVTISSCNCN